MNKEYKRCEICSRYFEGLEEHHIVFRSSGGSSGPTIEICQQCHRLVHKGKIKVRESLLTQDEIKYVIHKKWPGWFRIDWGR